MTASSVFDFDGDGRAEVIYADETSFRILDGTTGDALFTDETHGSHTRLEMAVIADVDNDGNAEVVIAENGSNGGNPGVEIWGDRADNWVFTRRIWNQHSYHVSNVSEAGAIPAYEEPNWWGANNFRQNVQGEGLFWAADLMVVNLTAACGEEGQLTVSFDLMNQGSRLVAVGAAATLYAAGSSVITVRAAQPLHPGDHESFTHQWQLSPALLNQPFDVIAVADDVGNGDGEHNECDEDNEARLIGLQCSYNPLM